LSNQLKSKIYSEFVDKKITFLGAGPMSKLVIDSIIELANEYKKLIAIIPSRRQIECADLGGGYVNSFSTEKFANYVRNNDKGSFVLLSRDHSGPWQLRNEVDGRKISFTEAMDESKKSLYTDLEVGFDLIHIDTSLGLNFGRNQEQVEKDLLELLEFCHSNNKNNALFEIGADEQSFIPDTFTQTENSLQRILNEIASQKLPKPLFFVSQTGTKVVELENIGAFNSNLNVDGIVPSSLHIPNIIKLCENKEILLKEHNADYLSDNVLKWHKRFGIHAANVAPEFGTTESKTLIEIAQSLRHYEFIDKFVELAIIGKKWEKWMLQNTVASDFKKTIISGHYHFNDEQFIELKYNLEKIALKNNIDVNKTVKNEVKKSISKYLNSFGYKNA